MSTETPTTQDPPPDGVPLRPDPGEGPPIQMNRVVFLGSAAGILVVALWALIAPNNAEATLLVLVGWTSAWFGWFYVLLATSILVFVVFIAMSKYGRTRLGPEHSRPEFSTFAWASMLFAAGIGTDLMFFSVAEPVSQFLAPPSGEPETVDAAREAVVWAMFHYGINGWGMYALMGMALGYFAYRMNLPLAVRSSLRPIFGKRVDGPLGDAVDIAAVLGTVFGVATTLGIAVVQLNFGLTMVAGWVPAESIGVQIALIVVGVAVATLSAVSGVDRGIKWLSQANVILAFVLALWIVITGRTTYFLDALVLNVGDFVSRFPDMTMQTFAYEDTGTWMADWTLFFWAWWAAWASFVGLFLARISRGRTIRQFVLGTLIIPFTYILMWISIYGNAALDLIRGGNAEFGELTMAQPEAGFYTLLAEYPAATFMIGLAIVVALLFYVTSADSGALVIANLSSRLPNVYADSTAPMRIFWAAAVGLLTIGLLAVGGVPTLQYATVVMGLPFAFVMALVMVGLFRALRVERFLHDARNSSAHGVLSGRSDHPPSVTWQHRMRRMMQFPGSEAADEFLTEVARSALEEVAAELGAQGVAADVHPYETDGQPGLELLADVGDDQPFCYRVSRREVPVPAYGGWAPRGSDFYSRLEVHLRLGGQGYDIMGYTHSQLIDDVLDQYERHLEFLRLHDGTSA